MSSETAVFLFKLFFTIGAGFVIAALLIGLWQVKP